jgi:polysaccharide biosynthesis/export protein
MRKIHLLFPKIFLAAAFFAFLFTGCVSQKQIRYLQQTSKEDTVLLWELKQAAEYKVQPNDNLYISIKSLSERANELFNQQMGATEMTSDASIYLNSYTVNREGNIDFPVIGKVFVRDMTVDQVKEKLQLLVSEYLKETIVIVKLVNFNVTLLGEVQKPGEYKIYQDRITIFEGIAMAGDFTDFANRKQVMLIRVTEKGSEIHYIDLSTASVLSSPYYYLKPNDVVYTAPLKVKQWGFATFPYAVIFAAISTLLLLLTYFQLF